MSATPGTPVIVPNASTVNTGFTSLAIPLTGITSGQPIVVGIIEYASPSAPLTGLSFSDTFATPYTYTVVENPSNTTAFPATLACALIIATGGAGAAGTITISGLVSGAYYSALAIPFTGASALSGLAALDGHGNNTNAASAAMAGPSLTPSVGTDGAISIVMCLSKVNSAGGAPFTNTFMYMKSFGGNQGAVATQPSPTSGVASQETWTQVSAEAWVSAGLLVKGAVIASGTGALSVSFNDVAVRDTSVFTPPVLHDRPWYNENAEAEGRPWEKGLFKFMHMDGTNRLKPRYVGVFALSDGTFRQSDPAGGFTNTDVPYPWDPNNPSAPYQTSYWYDLSQNPPTLQVTTVSHTVWVIAYFDRPTQVSSVMAANLITAGYGAYLS